MSQSSLRSAAGRIGGYELHARHDSHAIAARARDGLLARFEREVRERAAAQGESLSPAELAKRIEYSKKAYYARLTAASVASRRRRASGDVA